MDSFLATPWQKLKGALFHCFPHHLLSRLTYWATRRRLPFNRHLIRAFIKFFNVDMDDAVLENIAAYETFNQFFTRELKPQARPVDHHPEVIVSPCDGKISMRGDIDSNTLLQAKGRSFSLNELLTAACRHSDDFTDGHYCAIYLSPRDYHRVHMPCDGQLAEMVYVPGRLFSVAPYAPKTISKLYARNERIIAVFKTSHGYMASVMIGAVNVAAIETVWQGLITPPHLNAPVHYNYTGKNINLKKGMHMGTFNMGSTVLVLFSRGHITGLQQLASDQTLKMGQAIGRLSVKEVVNLKAP